MLRPLCIGMLLVAISGSSFAGVDFIRQMKIDFSTRDMKRIEKTLTREFPITILRRRAKGKSKEIISRITYFPVRQRSRLYVLAVSSAKWNDYASRFTMYRIYRDSIVRIYTSRSWLATYPVYGFDVAAAGKEQFILFSEGTGDHERHELASVFTFGQYKGKTFIRDLTPSMPGMSVNVEFPFRPLYAKAIKLVAYNTVILSASDNFTPNSRWGFDKAKRRFIADQAQAVTSTSLGQ